MEVQRFNQSFEELVAILDGEDWHLAGYAAQALGELGDNRAIDPLLEMLTPARIEWPTIIDVANALVRLGGESIIEPLWNVVLNPAISQSVREKTAVALATVGPQGQALLFSNLQHADSEVRWAVMAGLSKLGDSKVVEALTSLLETETDILMPIATMLALGNSKNPQAIQPIIKLLETSNVPVRSEAMDILSYTNNPAAIPVLAKILLTDKSRQTRALAAEALGCLGFEPAIQPLLKGLLEDSYSVVRFECACGLWHHTAAPIAQELIFALHDPVARVRERVAYLLGNTNDPQAIRPLLEVALNEAEKVNVRAEAIEALGKLKAIAARDSLLSLLSHKRRDLRAAAAEALGNIGDLAVFEPLVKALTDRFPDVCEKAAKALGQLKHPDSAFVLLARLEVERDSYVYDSLVSTLGKLGDKRAVEPLLKELARNKAARSDILHALGELGDSQASDAVAEFLQTADLFIYHVAVYALAKLGDFRGLDVLVSRLRDYDSDARRWTIEFLAELGEKALPALPTLDWLSKYDRNENHLDEDRIITRSLDWVREYSYDESHVESGNNISIREVAAKAVEKILASLNNS